MTAIRTLIVDDMPPARSRVRRALAKADDFEVIGECGDGAAAITSIRELQPDLVFLDVQMPEIDGFGVVAALEPSERPVILFVTAHDEYALRAFEVHALDYLLKPFDNERFERALERVREQVRLRQGQGVDRRLESLLKQLRPDTRYKQLRPDTRYLRRIAVKARGRTRLINVADIDWIGAEGNYLNLHVGSETHLIRETMATIEQQLDPDRFARIHRSTIVNLDRVSEISPLFNGDQSIRLANGEELTASRSHYDNLKSLLGER
jgi:two-component system LytT family response regulator